MKFKKCTKKKSAVYNKFITTKGNCCTDKNVIVNELNKYFTNIGHNLNAKVIQTVHDPTHYINNNPANSFCTPTCPTEIINIVHSNNSKSLEIMTTLTQTLFNMLFHKLQIN